MIMASMEAGLQYSTFLVISFNFWINLDFCTNIFYAQLIVQYQCNRLF